MEKNKSTKTTVKKSPEPRHSRRVQDSKPNVAKRRGGGSLDPGPNKPKK